MNKFWVQPDDDRAGPLEVKADYVRIDDGHLIFRNVSAVGGYPVLVLAIAPGHWRVVEPVL